MQRFTELSLNAQTTYAELFEQAQAVEMDAALSGFPGAFHKRRIKGCEYWYFGYRDHDGRGRMVYVGPESDRVRKLVNQFDEQKAFKPLQGLVRAAEALGCEGVLPKHFKIIRRLAEYGFFRAGGLLIGTHAFLALGNLLGVRWGSGQRTQDVDFAHAGRNVSIALPASIEMSVHDALTSLELGLLPASQFSGKTGAQYRNPADPELRLDFVTAQHRPAGQPVELPSLGVVAQPLKFMEFSLIETTQVVVLGGSNACITNVPDPARFAAHKLIIYGERPVSDRLKAHKDLQQVACLLSCFLAQGMTDRFNEVWHDALGRGPGWVRRAKQGKNALLGLAPELNEAVLWRDP